MSVPPARSSPERESSPADSTLGTALAAMRHQKGLSGQELGRRVGISQSKISRLEHGLAVPTRDEIDNLVAALGGTTELAEDWGARAARLRDQIVDTRSEGQRFQVGPLQAEIGRLEQGAETIRIFQAGVVPGLLQTDEYARAILTSYVEVLPGADAIDKRHEIFSAVTRRMQRQEVLQDPAKRIEIVFTESVLQFRLCPPEVMLVQLRKIRELARLDNVTVGIVPMGIELKYPPVLGFQIVDGKIVWLDMPTTVVYAHSDDDVHAFMVIFAAYLERAVTNIDPILDQYAQYHLKFLEPTILPG
jgi:transcriptional regulator with XRE-family HTH domain